MGNRLIRVLDRLVNAAVLIAVALILAISVYSLMDNLWLYRNAQDETLLVYKPPLTGALTAENRISENQVAWLTLNGTTIDYPVMQGENNYEYLNKDPYGEFKLSGSIFLDYINKPDFSEEYSLIYGHHMEYNSMFGALDQYLDQTYFDEHNAGTLITEGAAFEIDLFAVCQADGTNPTLFSPSGRTTEEITAFLNKNASIYTDYEEGCPILALSTCYGETAEARLLVFGMLKRR